MKSSNKIESTRKYYVVSCRGDHDDDFFKFSSLGMLGSNPHQAWARFLALVGGDRSKWNKAGYIAVPVWVTAVMQQKMGKDD